MPGGTTYTIPDGLVEGVDYPAPPDIRLVKLDELNVDPRYQRRKIPKVIERIAKDFDPVAAGAMVVGFRNDGSGWVVDAQQRRESMTEKGFGYGWASCFQSQGYRDEAARFDRINGRNRIPIGALQQFKSLIAKGDYKALCIRNAVENAGMYIPLPPGLRRIKQPAAGALKVKCVRTLQAIYEHGRDLRNAKGHLEMVLDIATRAWGKHPEQAVRRELASNEVLCGLSILLAGLPTLRNDKKSIARLVHVLSGILPKDPKTMYKEGKTIPEWRGKHALHFAICYLRVYNGGLHAKNRLALTFTQGEPSPMQDAPQPSLASKSQAPAAAVESTDVHIEEKPKHSDGYDVSNGKPGDDDVKVVRQNVNKQTNS